MKKVFEDIELVKRLQKGDVKAFDLIYDKYSHNLYAFGLKYLRLPDEAEELVQSVFLKIWECHKSLRQETSFKSFIFTIAYNDICKLFRRRHYQQKFIGDMLYENSQPTSEYEDRIDSRSLLERVQTIIEKLPIRQRAIFLKSRQEYKSTREIAEELGLSPGTVDNYVSESLKFIRCQLQKDSMSVFVLLMLFFF